MKYSKFFIPTVKEAPGDADIVSHKLMHRSGMIRKLASGIYEWLPLGYRVLKKVEEIIRQEMNAIDGLEVWLPALLPKELWEETGRWSVYGKELMRVKDRHNRDFALGPTHEEIITDLVRHEVRSYKELPLMFYQFQTKFRDEIRPRFGVMRAREFYMKDAYSFHADEDDAQAYYKKAYDAYCKIFERCGLRFQAVEALTGAIGGSFSHEFMVLASTGEEGIVSCSCGYGANTEKAEFNEPQRTMEKEKELSLEEVHTPNQRTVEELVKFMKSSPDRFIKTLIYLADDKPLMVLVRGDREVNDKKLQELINANELLLADEETIKKVTGAPLGFAGPARAKKGKSSKKSGIRIVADISVKNVVNAVSGANKKDYHFKNINIGRDYEPDEIMEFAAAKEGDLCTKCGKELKFSRGIEVGHTFKLGTKYSSALKATYTSQSGEDKLFVMGCYGIGVSRIVAAAIEQCSDERGIIWPKAIAPFHVCIVPINYEEPKTRELSDKLHKELEALGFDVLLDDRPHRVGVKFSDADLIGAPVRLAVSEKKITFGKIGLKLRSEQDEKEIAVDSIIEEVKKQLAE